MQMYYILIIYPISQVSFLTIKPVFIMYGGYIYNQDLGYSSNPMDFHEERYVGGDAYNYIISASRSAAVMVKSLFWVILGCTSIIISRTIRNTK